jgi:hypothetical protein
VPIVGSLNLLSHYFSEDILAAFRQVLTSTYFSFGGQLYQQTDRVDMGSLLSPAIVTFIMEDFKERALQQVTLKLL